MEEAAIFESGICLSYKLYDKNRNIKEAFALNKDSFDYKILEIIKNDNKNLSVKWISKNEQAERAYIYAKLVGQTS